jgi:hypothetical protein
MPALSAYNSIDLAEREAEFVFQLGDFRAFPWFDQSDGDALFPGSSSSAAAMGVIFHLFGKLVMDDE